MQIKSELKYLVFINKSLRKMKRMSKGYEQAIQTGREGTVCSVADRRAETGPTKAETFRGLL